MMIRNKLIVAVFFYFGTMSIAPAQIVSPFCSQSDVKIYFGNGVFNESRDAYWASWMLEFSLANRYPDLHDNLNIGYRVSYNPTGGLLDIVESVFQDTNTDASQFWLMMNGIEEMPEALKSTFLTLNEFWSDVSLLNPTLLDHLSSYQNALVEGNKVIVVAHSQGNFFTNQAYQQLTTEERESFGIVSVANPDSFVGGGGPYTTLEEDLVIGGIIIAKTGAGLFPVPMTPNVTNRAPDGSFTNSDFFGHQFLSAYLEKDNPHNASKNIVLDDIVGSIATLVQPTAISPQGIITVALRWGSQPDLDLHVVEPTGTHVYWNNRFGDGIGTLDIDDIDGFGPEHYSAPCAGIVPGTYAVGVNFYNGTPPETAKIEVKADSVVLAFEKVMTVVEGAGGVTNPEPVANVIVTGNSTDGFEFSIEERTDPITVQ